MSGGSTASIQSGIGVPVTMDIQSIAYIGHVFLFQDRFKCRVIENFFELNHQPYNTIISCSISHFLPLFTLWVQSRDVESETAWTQPSLASHLPP